MNIIYKKAFLRILDDLKDTAAVLDDFEVKCLHERNKKNICDADVRMYEEYMRLSDETQQNVSLTITQIEDILRN